MKLVSVRTLIIVIACLSGLYFILLANSFLYWVVLRMGSSPQIIEQIEAQLSKRSSSDLLGKLRAMDNPFCIDYYSPYPRMAMEQLARRDEKRAVPILVKLSKSKRSGIRINAIIALGSIKDPRALSFLLDIYRRGKPDSPEHSYALEGLATFRNEEVYPEIYKMAFNKKTIVSAINMLSHYSDKREVIQLLQKIADNDPDAYTRDQAYFKLEDIKRKNGESIYVPRFNN